MDLSAQEVNLSVPELPRSYHQRRAVRNPTHYRVLPMDLLTVVAIVILLGWATATFTTDAPGWVNLLLTGGVFLLIWRIVVRGTHSNPGPK